MKYMSIKEFRDKGFLQEINRQVLHPAGLAIQVEIIENTGEEKLINEIFCIQILDYRDNKEGIIFDENYITSKEAFTKFKLVQAEQDKHFNARFHLLGSSIQHFRKDKPSKESEDDPDKIGY